MENKITFIKETFENSQTGKAVDGITVIIDGVFQQVLDKIIRESNGKYADYTAVLKQRSRAD